MVVRERDNKKGCLGRQPFFLAGIDYFLLLSLLNKRNISR